MTATIRPVYAGCQRRGIRTLAVAGLLMLLAFGARGAQATSLILEVGPNPSTTGDLSLSWGPASSQYELSSVLECEGTSADCPTFEDFTTLLASTNAHSLEVRGKPEGTYTYRVVSCPNIEIDFYSDSDFCVYSPTVTVEVDYLAGTRVESANAVGGMAYETGVTKGGDAFINIPVSVVPGVNGMQPMLSIDYSDGRERQRADAEAPGDLLGYGWRIGGLSTIRRCVRHSADSDGISLDSTDGLCLDGEPLVLVSGKHLQPGATYRTLRESFMRVGAQGTTGTVWFKVELADGRVREYGRTPDSELRFETVSGEVPNETVPVLWSVNKATDAFGNQMTYEYREEEARGARHPKRIVYGDSGDAEVVFEYTGRPDVDAMPVAGRTQHQWLRLHRLAVRLDGRDVREYRLESESASEGWIRLSKVQLCGWRNAGSGTRECLEPMSITWENPAQALPNMKTCVASIEDPLGRSTEFERGILTATGTHDFLFTAAEEKLFGSGTTPADAAALPANSSGNVKSLVTAVLRDNGVGGEHKTSYAYQGRGWRSTRNWGFLGFYATRETDSASGVSTYTQYRLDFPHIGSSAAIVVSEGLHGSAGAEVLSRQHFTYSEAKVAYGSGAGAASTHLPYASATTSLVYEGGTELGAVQTSASAPTVSGTAVAKTVETTVAGHSASKGTAGTVWGDAGTHTVGSVQRKTRTTTDFNNVSTTAAWLAGFPSSVRVERFKGTSTTATRTQTLTRTRAKTSSSGHTGAVGKEVVFPGDDKLQLTTSYTHDSNGNVTAATTVGGSKGHVPTRTDKRSSFKDARYPGKIANALGHSETLRWDSALGLPTEVRDANGRILRIGYDAFGREVSRERAWDGVTETTTYAACGSSCAAVSATSSACGTASSVTADLAMKVTTTSPDAPGRVAYHDELGRVVRASIESFASSTVRRLVDTLHDGRGLVACESEPYHTGGTKRYASYRHDARGRVTSVRRADGGSVSVTYSAEASTSRLRTLVREKVLDADRSVLSGTRDSEYYHNIMGEMVETVAGAQAAVDKRSITRYAYDAGGLLDTVTVENGAADVVTSFGHDAAGNRTGVSNPNFADSTLGYTALGQLRERRDARGTTTWTRDLLGRVTGRTDPGGGAAAWKWDPSGALGLLDRRTYNDATSTAVEFEESYSYDSDERLKATTTTIRNSAMAADSLTVKRSHTYDSKGRPETMETSPSKLKVGYEYNARGYLSRLKRGTSALATRTAVDARGNATGTAYGNGVSTTRAFDERGRVTAIGTAKGGAKVQEETYSWRSDGLLGRRAVGSGSSRDTEVFGHDHLGRLLSAATHVDQSGALGASTVDRTLTHGYDRLGNMTSMAGGAIGYTGTGNAGPHAATTSAHGGGTKISYDTAGHVVRYDAASGDDTHIEWDGRGMVSRITVGDSGTDTTPVAREEFRYGPDGERYFRRSTWTEEVTDAETGETTTRTRQARIYRVGGYERVVHDGLGEHAWVDKTLAGPAQLVRRAESASAAPSGELEYLHGDHLGSLSAVTDASGGVEQSLAHDPYGTRRSADWGSALPEEDVRSVASAQDEGRSRRGFTGHETLDRTGFVHMGGRLYDPRIGRFMSPDPIISEPASGQGWNLYSYVGNSPLSRTDPSGLCYAAGPQCPGAHGGGFTPVSPVLAGQHFFWRHHLVITIRWGWAFFGGSVLFWNSDSHRVPVPMFSFLLTSELDSFPTDRAVSLGQEASPADGKVVGGVGDSVRNWWLEMLYGKYIELKSECESIHGAGGCDDTTVKEIVDVFGDVTTTLGAATVGATVARASGKSLFPPIAARWRLSQLDRVRMAQEGLKPDRNMLTKAGRSLQKHGSRQNDPFPPSTGKASEMNARGQRILEEILWSPNQNVVRTPRKGRQVIDLNTGRGVEYHRDGSMKGFIDGQL